MTIGCVDLTLVASSLLAARHTASKGMGRLLVIVVEGKELVPSDANGKLSILCDPHATWCPM